MNINDRVKEYCMCARACTCKKKKRDYVMCVCWNNIYKNILYKYIFFTFIPKERVEGELSNKVSLLRIYVI